MGSNDVTAMGKASVIQNTAISIMMYAHFASWQYKIIIKFNKSLIVK